MGVPPEGAKIIISPSSAPKHETPNPLKSDDVTLNKISVGSERKILEENVHPLTSLTIIL